MAISRSEAAADSGAASDQARARVLVAPDSFKGTFAAGDVATAISRGLAAAGCLADACPLADGGEGTADALLRAHGGRGLAAEFHDPLGRAMSAELALLGDGVTAVVEVAAASGLPLVAEHERDAEAASSFGTGELIVAAVAAGARQVLVGAGGSATTDGGAGALETIDAAGGLRGARLSVLCDVRTPWERAPARFGPQKGADLAAVQRLEQRRIQLAERLPRDPRGVPMTGCAGGLSGGLWAVHGAELLPGARWIMGAARVDRRLQACAAVVTGEGRLDEQSLEGKVVGELVTRARRQKLDVFAIVGRCALSQDGIQACGLAGVAEAETLERMELAAMRIGETSVGTAAPT